MKAKDKVEKISGLLKSKSFSDSHATKTNILKEMEGCTLSEIAEALMEYMNVICDIRDILEEE